MRPERQRDAIDLLSLQKIRQAEAFVSAYESILWACKDPNGPLIKTTSGALPTGVRAARDRSQSLAGQS